VHSTRTRFSPGTPASSTTKTGRHDIAEILLKWNTKNQIKSIKVKTKELNSIKKLMLHHEKPKTLQLIINRVWLYENSILYTYQITLIVFG